MTAIELQRPADGGGIFRRLTVEVDGKKAAALKYNSKLVYGLYELWRATRSGGALT